MAGKAHTAEVHETAWGTHYSYPHPVRLPGGGLVTRPADPALASDHLWAKLLLGGYGLAVRYDCSERLDCLLVDLDLTDAEGIPAAPLVTWEAGCRATLMDKLAEAVRQVEEALGCPLFPHWMASGGKGVWLQLFLEEPVERSVLRALLDVVKAAVPGTVGEYRARVDGNNLGAQCCRIPCSRHLDTGEVAVFLDPVNWEPHEDQLAYLLGIGRSVSSQALMESLGAAQGRPEVAHLEGRSQGGPPAPPV